MAPRRGRLAAAARLGMAQSALSQIVRRTEERVGIRLLSRTTRSVAPTDAGERLLATLGPMLHDIDSAITSLGEFRDQPAGTIRITTVEHAAKTILVPAMKRMLLDHPDITVEMTIDYGLADVVADRFDAGVRLGGEIAKDMIAVRIGPDTPMAIVGAPSYFRSHPAPTSATSREGTTTPTEASGTASARSPAPRMTSATSTMTSGMPCARPSTPCRELVAPRLAAHPAPRRRTARHAAGRRTRAGTTRSPGGHGRWSGSATRRRRAAAGHRGQ